MSDPIRLIRRRGNQTDKDVATEVMPEGQTAVVLDEKYHVLGDGVTQLKDLRPMEDRRVATATNAATYVITNVSPSIIEAETFTGVVTIQLPDLAENRGRAITVLNRDNAAAISLAAAGSDGIGAAGDATVPIPADRVRILAVAGLTYWHLHTIPINAGGGGGGAGMPIGSLIPFGGTSAPPKTLLCDGAEVSRVTYADLFAAIGTTWGPGNGIDTFNVPDLRGAFLRGAGSHGSETMADGNAFAGPSVGSFELDQIKDHEHSIEYFKNGSNQNWRPGAQNPFFGNPIVNRNSNSVSTRDPGDGAPRFGAETRPFNAGVNWVIQAES